MLFIDSVFILVVQIFVCVILFQILIEVITIRTLQLTEITDVLQSLQV